MKIEHLRTNHMECPVGFALEPLTFSWITSGISGTKTEKIRILIAQGENFENSVYDSGWVAYPGRNLFYPEFDRKERQGYFWKIFVENDLGERAESAPAYFRTGTCAVRGEWVSAPGHFQGNSLVKKKFYVKDKEIREACLYVTGLGVYEVRINGEKTGDEFLAPFYNDYTQWIQLQTYEVTKQLTAGENTIGFFLGDGWYKGRFGFIDGLDCLYGEEQAILCELEIQYQDGEIQRVISDESFLFHSSPIIKSSIYDGEYYDARKAPGLFQMEAANRGGKTRQTEKEQKTRISDAGWEKGVLSGPDIQEKRKLLCLRKSLPLKIQEHLPVKNVILTPAGETVLDFGQNMTGIFSFLCEEPRGNKIRFLFGEILQDGNFYNENLRTARQEYVYISDGISRTVRPYFTFYGFRYVKVEGIRDIKPDHFTALVMHSDLESTGTITTSDAEVNRLFLNALWGQKGNFVDTPTDCPQRDERMGWTGDAQVFCSTASFNMYTPAFYEKYLYDMLFEQKQLSGAVPHVVPDILNRIRFLMQSGKIKGYTADDADQTEAAGSCAWGDAATIIPWTVYMFYGDKELLRKQYENMRLWVDYIHRIDEEKCGGQRLWKYGFHFADWLALDSSEEGSLFGGTDPYFIASVYYSVSAALTGRAAEILGYGEDAEKYAGLSREVKEAVCKEYFDKNGDLTIGTQTAFVLSLYFHIYPDGQRDRLVKKLAEKIDERGGHLATGFVGTPYLCPVLCESGLEDYAYTLLLNRDYPGWLYEVGMGATTIWERWNSVLPDGRISDTGMNSLNHYAYGSIAGWMYKYMCGIVPDEAEGGFRHFSIRPYVDKRLKFAHAKYRSSFGDICSGWERVSGGWKLNVEIPFDTTAGLYLEGELSGCRIVKCEKIREEMWGDSRTKREKFDLQKPYLLSPGIYEILLEEIC